MKTKMKNLLISQSALIVVLLISTLIFSCKKEETEDEDNQGDTTRIKDEFYIPVINVENFIDGISNPYSPFKPGDVYTYEAQMADGKQVIEVTVTDATKRIMGIKCIVITDIVKDDNGDIVENTVDWYAQDKDGNVWYFGEDTQELENGEVVSTAGTWQAGVDGAQPGIVMPGTPIFGIPYRQEYYFNEAEDLGKVVRTGETVTTPFGTFNDCLVTEEWSAIEPGIIENKYYAPGLGQIKAIMILGGNEIVELTNISK